MRSGATVFVGRCRIVVARLAILRGYVVASIVLTRCFAASPVFRLTVTIATIAAPTTAPTPAAALLAFALAVGRNRGVLG